MLRIHLLQPVRSLNLGQGTGEGFGCRMCQRRKAKGVNQRSARCGTEAQARTGEGINALFRN